MFVRAKCECVCCVSAAQRKKSSVASLDPEGMNVEVGDQVLVAGQKHGIVRFYGKTDFAPGLSALPVLRNKTEMPVIRNNFI